MSYWNHRLVKDVESGRLAIHEVYYDDDGTPTGYTENPVFIDKNRNDDATGVTWIKIDCLKKSLLNKRIDITHHCTLLFKKMLNLNIQNNH